MKLRNKLILSCAALAAVATTAVSTTFAWYTNNTEVTAKGITGTTKSSDQSVLMISKDDYNWSSKVELGLASLNLVPVEHVAEDTYTEVATTAGTTVVTGLYTKEGNTYTEITAADTKAAANTTYYELKAAGFYGWNQSENVANTAATVNTDYFAFDLYFKSGTTDSLNVFVKKFNLVNTTSGTQEGLPAKVKLNSAGLPVASTTYTVDMFRALTIEQTTGNTLELLQTPSQDVQPVAPQETTLKTWDCQSLTSTDSLGSSATLPTGTNAHKYYNAVKGLFDTVYTEASISAFAENTKYYTKTGDVYTEVAADAEFDSTKTYYTAAQVSAGIDETKTNSITTRENLKNTGAQGYDVSSWQLGVTGAGSTDAEVASSVLKVTFIIYLDGWDLACFDACQGQNFTLDMEFASTKYVAPANNNNNG